MTITADVVALINKQDDRLAVWHVVIDPSWPMGRLCGAWVETLAPALYEQRYLLPFGGQLPDGGLTHLEPSSAGMFDATATRDAIAAEIAKLDARHQDSLTKAGKARASVTWPRMPERLDWTTLPAPPRGVADDPLTSTTIAVAQWVSRLADVWSSVEVNRLSRDHLSDDDDAPRPMPVALRA